MYLERNVEFELQLWFDIFRLKTDNCKLYLTERNISVITRSRENFIDVTMVKSGLVKVPAKIQNVSCDTRNVSVYKSQQALKHFPTEYHDLLYVRFNRLLQDRIVDVHLNN